MTNSEINAFYQSIQNCTNLQSLNEYYEQMKNTNHPAIFHNFGVKFLIYGDKAKAKNILIKGATFGIKYPCKYYDNLHIDAVGQCFTLLVTQFRCYEHNICINATALGYIYLSRCLELYGHDAYDSHRSRAILFLDNEDKMAADSIICDNVGIGILVDPFIISDFYFASQDEYNPNREIDLTSARNEHANLEDITISGKDANEYSLSEISALGERRHFNLFKALEKKYINGEINLNLEDLNEFI